jgi:hypothetical protein
LEEFDTILKDATLCLTSRFFFRYVQDSYSNIKRRIDKIGSKKVNDIVDSAGDFDDTIPTDTTGESFVPALTNPFNLHFEKPLKSILNQMEGEPDPTVELNGSWCPQFFKFMQSYIGEMALWSGVLLGSPDRYKRIESPKVNEVESGLDKIYLSFKSANAKSEGYIEGVMRQLKQEDFPGKKQIIIINSLIFSESITALLSGLIHPKEILRNFKRSRTLLHVLLPEQENMIM